MIATALQIAGAVLVTLAVGVLLGAGAGLLAAGVSCLAFGVAEELG